MVEKSDFSPRQVDGTIKRINIWYSFNFRGLEFGLSSFRAQELHKFGLHILGDLWKTKIKNFHS